MASSSSSRSTNKWNHDVFLSFRGPDTRNTFTDHLHHELRSKGIDVFNDTELQRGELITSQLLQVIEESRISIVVLSEKYASSSFCLDELEKILETREFKGQTVIPVFYHVDPTDVEEQRGTFGQEFTKLKAQLNKHLHSWKLFPSIAANFLRNVSLMWPTVDDLDEQRNNDEEAIENIMKRKQKWTLALTQIAKLSGWHLEKGDHESNIIQDIVKKVSRKLDYTLLHVAEYPVGLTSRVEYIIEKLNREIQDVCMLGLHGMGGVGKTTIARALYNTYASQFEFEGSCFLSKVRENSRNIVEVQQTLLSQLLGYQGQLIKVSEEGIELIKRKLRNKKVLIVIDDVNHREQLQQLVGGLEWFGGGSIIIITTRNLHLLEQHGVTMIHEIKELELDESLQLFSWYAFKESQPDEVHMELSRRVIMYTRGLPLALVVLGSLLYKRSAPQWDDMLKKLKQCPNKEINDVLKVSYDSLDDEEKTIFLDIAFFFKGKDMHKVTKFLDVCGFGAHLGIERLIQNSLVYVDCKTLEMHDLLREMGNKIALTECSRLCIREREDILRLFVENKTANDVEILVLDLYGEEEVSLNWLQNLTKLRALAIRNGRFIKMPKKLPNSIKWLEWHNSRSTTISSGFLPHNLIAIEMFCSNIKKFDISKAQKFMNLTFVNLSGSKHLREILDVSSIPNIEKLNLKGCKKLKKIHKSVGSLEQLKKLNLEGCCSLTSLPNLGKNKGLFYLHLRNCSKLENLPNLPTTLSELLLDNSGIKEIPSFIGNLHNLLIISASRCRNLTSVSNSIYKLFHKICINLNDCPKLLQLPEAESSMLSSNPTSRKISWHHLSGNKFVHLPISTFKFIYMEALSLDNCKWLVEIPELPLTLVSLTAKNCKSLLRFSQFQFRDTFEGNFINCHEIVGENEKKSWREMVEKGWRTEREKVYQHRRPYRYNVILPGNEIPEWFSYAFNCNGRVHSFKLPSSIFNANLIGIACSAIFQRSIFALSMYSRHCEIKFSINAFIYTTTCISSPLASEPHMWLGFKYVDFDLPKLSEAEGISCKFHCDDKRVVLKGVGVHLIYKIEDDEDVEIASHYFEAAAGLVGQG